jgi:hypothetical protein
MEAQTCSVCRSAAFDTVEAFRHFQERISWDHGSLWRTMRWRPSPVMAAPRSWLIPGSCLLFTAADPQTPRAPRYTLSGTDFLGQESLLAPVQQPVVAGTKGSQRTAASDGARFPRSKSFGSLLPSAGEAPGMRGN